MKRPALVPIGSFVLFFALCGPHVLSQRPVLIDGVSPELVSDQFELADGAAWDGGNRLYVPDVKAKRVLQFDLKKPDKEPQTIVEGLAVSGTCYQLGRLYLSDNRGARIATVGKNGKVKTLAQFEPKERPNDLTVDADGNVFVTITGAGIVRVAADGTFATIASGITTPNGIALSPRGNTLYVSSAKLGTIYRIDLAGKQAPDVAAKRFAQLPETEDGFRGDGMCVDRSGHLFVTAAKAVHVFDPSGESVGVIEPPHRPINAIIAGSTSKELFLSTFGGLYRMPINRYGVSPHKPTKGDDDSPVSTVIDDALDAQLNVVYSKQGHRELLLDYFRPRENDGPLPAVVVVHGGGWKKGDKNKFRALALRLAERGYACAAIEYRLSGEAAFPAAIQDCNAAVAFLRGNAKRFGIDPERIAAVGGSAGGHLVGLMAAGSENPLLRHAADRSADVSLKAAVVLAGPLEIASGPVAEKSLDEEKKSESNAILWMDGDVKQARDLYFLADAYEKVDPSMPPTLFISGSKDTPERNQKTREKMSMLGIPNQLVVHEGAKHGHWNQADWIQTVADDIDAFLKEHL